jgi:hypothetical protein
MQEQPGSALAASRNRQSPEKRPFDRLVMTICSPVPVNRPFHSLSSRIIYSNTTFGSGVWGRLPAELVERLAQ